MPGPHKGVSNQHTNQQILAKPRHQPSERDQQARDRLKHKAKLKSHAYIQLEKKKHYKLYTRHLSLIYL